MELRSCQTSGCWNPTGIMMTIRTTGRLCRTLLPNRRIESKRRRSWSITNRFIYFPTFDSLLILNKQYCNNNYLSSIANNNAILSWHTNMSSEPWILWSDRKNNDEIRTSHNLQRHIQTPTQPKPHSPTHRQLSQSLLERPQTYHQGCPECKLWQYTLNLPPPHHNQTTCL